MVARSIHQDALSFYHESLTILRNSIKKRLLCLGKNSCPPSLVPSLVDFSYDRFRTDRGIQGVSEGDGVTGSVKNCLKAVPTHIAPKADIDRK